MVWGDLIGFNSINENIGEDLNKEALVNGATRRVDIMGNSGTPIWDREQLPWGGGIAG